MRITHGLHALSDFSVELDGFLAITVAALQSTTIGLHQRYKHHSNAALALRQLSEKTGKPVGGNRFLGACNKRTQVS